MAGHIEMLPSKTFLLLLPRGFQTLKCKEIVTIVSCVVYYKALETTFTIYSLGEWLCVD